MKKLIFAFLIIVSALSISVIYSCKKNDNTSPNNPTVAITPSGSTTIYTGDSTTLTASGAVSYIWSTGATTPSILVKTTGNYSVTGTDASGTKTNASIAIKVSDVQSDNNSTADEDVYNAENDQLNQDVTNDVENYHPGMRKVAGTDRFQSYSPPCGATVDTSQIGQKKIIYNFDGTTNCWGRTRSGTITVQLSNGNHWRDTGAVLTFTATNYKVTRISDNRSITINGTKTITDTYGINWYGFYFSGDTIKYTERAINVQVSFSNGRTAVWNSARTATWSYNNSTLIYTFTCNGDTNITPYTNVSNWGVNRFGYAFYTHYNAPIVCSTQCIADPYDRPLSGTLVHNVFNSSLTLTLGLDGTPAHNPYTGNGCPWGYNINFVLYNGASGSLYLPYW